MIDPFKDLMATLHDKADWVRSTTGAKHVSVKLTQAEIGYLIACAQYYVSDTAMRRAEKLPLAGLPPIKIPDATEQQLFADLIKHGIAVQRISPADFFDADTLPSETEPV